MAKNLLKAEASVLNPSNYNLEDVWKEDVKNNPELFQMLDKTGGFQQIKNAYMRYLNRMKKESPAEAIRMEQFWNQVNNLPWDKQKLILFYRYNRDYNIPELSAIRRDYNLYTQKNKTKNTAVKEIATNFIQEENK